MNKLILLLTFLFLPLFANSQILDEQTILKKRDSLTQVLSYYNNQKSIYIFKLDSLKSERNKESKKRIVNLDKMYTLSYYIKETENKIYFTNKQMSNSMRLIRKYPLPVSATPKPKTY